MQDLSCAPALCTVHFGNTGEKIKRMQGTRESPKISVIEINVCEVRPKNDNCGNAICISMRFSIAFGRDEKC